MNVLFSQIKSRLSERDRQILVLLEQDLGAQEIAKAFKISYSAAGKAIQRARERMAAILSAPKINGTRKTTTVHVPEPLELRFGNPEFKVKPIRQFFLEANPNPERQAVLTRRRKGHRRESAARRSSGRLHLASCSPCFAEFRSFKVQVDNAQSSRLRILAWAIAACLLLAVGIYGSRLLFKKSEPNVVKGEPDTGGPIGRSRSNH